MNTADTASGFDTPVVMRKLEAAGGVREQAEAHAEALRNGRAAKADIARRESLRPLRAAAEWCIPVA